MSRTRANSKACKSIDAMMREETYESKLVLTKNNNCKDYLRYSSTSVYNI